MDIAAQQIVRQTLVQNIGAAQALNDALDLDVVVVDLRAKTRNEIGRPADTEGGRQRRLGLQMHVAAEYPIVLTGRILLDMSVLRGRDPGPRARGRRGCRSCTFTGIGGVSAIESDRRWC